MSLKDLMDRVGSGRTHETAGSKLGDLKFIDLYAVADLHGNNE